MSRRIAGLTTTLAAAALVAVPLVGRAQPPSTQTPTTQSPATPAPTTQSTQRPSTQTSSPAASQSNQPAQPADGYLKEARRVLNGISGKDLDPRSSQQLDVVRTDFAKLETDYNRVVNHTAVGTSGTTATAPAPTGTTGTTATPPSSTAATPPASTSGTTATAATAASTTSAMTNDWRPAYTALESDLRELAGTQAEQSSATTGASSGATGTTGTTVGTATSQGTTGTAGTTAAAAPKATTGSAPAAGTVNVPANVRSQLDEFRQDLQKFYAAAAGQAPPQNDALSTATAPPSGAVGTTGTMSVPGRSERAVAAEPRNADVLLQRIEDIVNNSISTKKPIERAKLDEIRAEVEQLKTLVQK